MLPSPFISANPACFSATSDFVLMLVGAAPRLGLPVKELLNGSGLSSDLYSQRGMPISLPVARKVWSSAAHISGDPLFGLHAAAQLEVGALDLLDYLTRSSSTWGQAVQRFIRFAPLIAHAGTFALEMRGSEVRFLHYAEHGVDAVLEMVMGLMLLRTRAFSGETLRPRSVQFRHSQRGVLGEYQRVFDAPVRFGADFDEMVFDRSVLDLPFISGEPRLGAILEAHAELRLQDLGFPLARPSAPADAGFLSEFRDALGECVRGGNSNLDRVAERMGLSTRTAQRLLRRNDTSHRTLLAEIRAALLEQHVTDAGGSTRRELAQVLAYASTRSVSRVTRPRRR